VALTSKVISPAPIDLVIVLSVPTYVYGPASDSLYSYASLLVLAYTTPELAVYFELEDLPVYIQDKSDLSKQAPWADVTSLRANGEDAVQVSGLSRRFLVNL
jgi:hypothetical protein